MSESIPRMTTKAWKLWAKQQIHQKFFATGPCMSNIYSFDEELGVYLTFAGNAVVRRLENVVWDEKAQVPAEKTKQQIYASMVAGTTRIQTNYAPSAAELEALRIINGLVLPSDIVDLLAQAGWDPSKCCNPFLEPQERKLQPRMMGDTFQFSPAHPLLLCPSSDLESPHFNKTSTSASLSTSAPLQTSMTPQPKQEAAVMPKPFVPCFVPVDSHLTPVTRPTSLAAQPAHLEQMPAKTTSSLSGPAAARPPETSATTSLRSPSRDVLLPPGRDRANSQNVMVPLSKPIAKAKAMTKRMTGAKTLVGWKRWANKQKNTVYSEPAFQNSSKTVDIYLGGLSWDEEGKKPADISQQLPYRQVMEQWEHFNNQGRPLPAPMMESVRIMNSLVIPADIVEMLAGGGWDAEKCCNPKLPREEKKLDTGLAALKRSIKDEFTSSFQAKKQKTTAAVSQQELSKVKNSLIGIPTPADQDSRESSLLITDVVIKTEEEFPKPAIPRPAGSLHNWTFGEMSDGASSHSCRGSIEADVGPHVVSNAAAIKNTRPVDIIGSPNVTKPSNPMKSSSRGAHEIDTSSSISPRRKKHTSRKGLKRTIDTVSSSLAVTSADHSVKLQDQAGRLRECSENLKDHSIQLQKHTKQLRKQDSALAQLRQDNQALRDCLQGVLLPLAQAVNALRKLSKDDKRALKSTKKRAERGLKEFKSVDKNTKVLKQSFENLRYILEAAEGYHGGKSDARGQEN